MGGVKFTTVHAILGWTSIRLHHVSLIIPIHYCLGEAVLVHQIRTSSWL